MYERGVADTNERCVQAETDAAQHKQ